MTKRDLKAQLTAYAQQLDDAAPDVEQLAPGSAMADPGSRDVVDRRRTARPTWLASVAAAAAVAAIVGSVAVFGALQGPTGEPPATNLTTTSTLVEPHAGTQAILVSPTPVIGTENPAPGDLEFFSMGDMVIDSAGVYRTLLGVETTPRTLVHAFSPDGSTWTVDTDPVDAGDRSDLMSLRATELIETDDGSWIGYFDFGRDLGDVGNHQYKFWIHRGTAPSIDGPWTIDPEPVLDAGAPGSWDSGWVRNASVIRSGGEWTMFYLGSDRIVDGSGSGALGRAVSEDGIIWTKDPAPVFTADDSRFEDEGLNRIEVKPVDDELLLTYAGRTGGNRAIAYSDDGFTWTRDQNNPILTTIEVPRGSIYDTALLYDEGVLRWYAGAGGFESMAVYELRLER